MMARVLGARVGRHPESLVEIGYHPIYPTAAGAAYFDGPTMFYQWHRETFEIPAGAVHLAHNDAFDAQMFRYGEAAFGIEFHPEMTRAMVERWTASERGAPMLALPGGQPRAAQLEGYRRYMRGERPLARDASSTSTSCRRTSAAAKSWSAPSSLRRRASPLAGPAEHAALGRDAEPVQPVADGDLTAPGFSQPGTSSRACDQPFCQSSGRARRAGGDCRRGRRPSPCAS